MILVDSSVWIDYFNGKVTGKTDWLDSAIGDKEIIVGDIILTEILQGFQNDNDFRAAQKLLSDFPFMEMLGQELAIKSALNYRFLRKNGVTVPGLALKSEMIGLAVITELPLVIMNVQRGGPSTGMRTKTEQADLLFALYGRHGEAPLPIIAARSPSDCYWSAIEAMRIAVKWMTPVILLTDGYLGFGSEPFRIPEASELKLFEVKYQTTPNYEGGKYMPYLRDQKLVRQWAIPGTAGLEHRVGGLEKDSLTGMVSYDGMNHEKMVKTRAQKIANVVEDVPDVEVGGSPSGDLVLVSWGGTYGSVRASAETLRAQGKAVGHVHLRWLNPLPTGNDQVRFEVALRTLAPELGIHAPVRDEAFKRPEQLEYLQARKLPVPPFGAAYSVNRGLWGTTIGGKETLTSHECIPDAAWVLTRDAFTNPQAPERHAVGFEQGIPCSLDGKRLDPVSLIEQIEVIGAKFGVGRGIHLADTIIGFKGRVAFDAPAAEVLLNAHRELEKLVLSRCRTSRSGRQRRFRG